MNGQEMWGQANLFVKHLKEKEKEYNLTVLLACENSSRAWGYNSANSDHDVFFVYKQNNLENYVGLNGYRETIEFKEYVNGKDVSFVGWDLKKALKLALKSNSMLVELVGVSYTQRNNVFINDINFRYYLSEYMLQHYSPFTLAKSYASTTMHHLDYDYNRFDDLAKKLKHLLAGFRAFSLCKDYCDNGMVNCLSNYSQEFLRTEMKMFDGEYQTDFMELLNTRLEGMVAPLHVLDQHKNLLMALDKTTYARIGLAKTSVSDIEKLNKILYDYLLTEDK